MVQESKADRLERMRVNLQSPQSKIFTQMVRTARGDSRALAGVAYAHERLGLPASWLRERMAGRIRVKPLDIEILDRVIDIAKSTPNGVALNIERDPTQSAEVGEYRRAVAKMCRECAPAPAKGDDQQCPDGQCPLRPVSPLELHPRAHRNPPIVGKDWAR
jgi:hypothetical protein